MRLVFLLLPLLLLPVPAARAATISTATCNLADVQTAVNQAQDGDTVLVRSGACSWSNPVNLSNAKGVTLMCETAGACTITSAGTAVLFNTLSGVNPRLYRISGFTFHNNAAGFVIWFDGNGTLSRIRVDHNVFSNPPEGTVAVFFGDTQGVANYYGVIDHNSLNSASSSTLIHMIGALNNTPPPSPIGTANNLFVEDNTISITTMTNAGQGCLDTWGGAAIVWRRNTSLNCLVTSHGVVHNGGPQNIELYDNVLKVDAGAAGQGLADGYRLFHHQGSGEFIAFNNSFTAFNGKSGDPLEMTHYRAAPPAVAGYDASLGRCDGTQARDGNRMPTATYYGYPCWRQPGRDFAGNLMPMYIWNNRWSDTGAKIDMRVETPWGTTNPTAQDHIKPDRDYYNAVSASAQTSPTAPFNGTTGMGFGTLANRPPTCTTNPLESGGGVGYFATDQGPQGTLYQCSATNTWTLWYTPYTYPHPLVAGGTAPPPDTTPPTVALTMPANSATVSGTVTLAADATDAVGVVGVQFKLDGANVGAEDTAPPYTLAWNSATAANGSHTLSAVARDAAGNTRTASVVTVIVSNSAAPPPPATPPATPPAEPAVEPSGGGFDPVLLALVLVLSAGARLRRRQLLLKRGRAVN